MCCWCMNFKFRSNPQHFVSNGRSMGNITFDGSSPKPSININFKMTQAKKPRSRITLELLRMWEPRQKKWISWKQWPRKKEKTHIEPLSWPPSLLQPSFPLWAPPTTNDKAVHGCITLIFIGEIWFVSSSDHFCKKWKHWFGNYGHVFIFYHQRLHLYILSSIVNLWRCFGHVMFKGC